MVLEHPWCLHVTVSSDVSETVLVSSLGQDSLDNDECSELLLTNSLHELVDSLDDICSLEDISLLEMQVSLDNTTSLEQLVTSLDDITSLDELMHSVEELTTSLEALDELTTSLDELTTSLDELLTSLVELMHSLKM